MTDDGKEKREHGDDATDSRTLDEIEKDQEVSADASDSPSPSPDEGSGRTTDDDSGAPM
ncbi:MAG TPA: hypothetical protein VE863_07365 [Pyrinomonadaceae bacterium]|nr:hypothetical protein [Pyrinomonadaceae bacterium]